MEPLRILVVDDEPVVVEVVQRYLEREGFTVDTAGDGATALERFESRPPQLVVLDLMLPRLDGLEVCRRVRDAGSTPVIMLTARGEEIDRLAGFEVGADDYLAKPFSPRELVARVKAVLRRSYDERALGQAGFIRHGAIALDARARMVSVGGVPAALTVREFDLLAYFMARPRHVFTRQQLLERVWGYSWASDASTVTVHVRRLRTKVERDPEAPEHLVTVWGVGYRWEP
jgi:DNA-binding response OmpR family regulator